MDVPFLSLFVHNFSDWKTYAHSDMAVFQFNQHYVLILEDLILQQKSKVQLGSKNEDLRKKMQIVSI